MNDNEKTKAQLIEELNELRAGVADHVLSSTGLGAKIMDCSGDAVYVIDPATGRILDVNSTACSNLGYSREELLAMGVTDIENTLPDDFSWKKHVDQLSPMTTHTQIGEHKRKDGTVFPVEVSIIISDDEEGYMVSIARDITERKKAEEALLKNESEAKSILQTALDGFWVVDMQGHFTEVNDSYCRMTGYSHDELLSMSVADVEAIDTPDDIQARIQRLIANGAELFETKHRHKDGRLIDLEVSINFLREAGKFFVFLRDITERKVEMVELARLKTAIEQAPIGIALADENLNLYFCNAAGLGVRGDGRKLIGIPKEEFSNWQVLKVDGEPYDVADLPLVRAFREKKVIREEFIVRHQDGSEHNCDAVAVPVYGENNSVIGSVVIFPDITERKQAETRERELRESLERATRMESLGVLAGGVAHDLNNVLGPLVALPEIISEDLADLEKLNVKEAQESLDMIGASAKRAATIVRDLVHLGRRGNYNLVHIDLSQIQCISPDCKCKALKQLKTTHPHVTFSNKPNKGPLIILGDESHLSRSVSNLVQNAAESIEKKGTVTIKTFKKSLDAPLIGYETVPQGDYAVIEISDTGEGIEKETLGRIFEPFYTRKKKSDRSGSGLGLSVVHGIVKDHNGFIDIKSEVGQGSVFALYLPLIAQPNERYESESAPVVGGSERILIVDDEPGQRFLSRISLERLGYEVAEAEDGHQALKYFEEAERASKGSPYDLILLDMTMEEGFDGLDTYEAILKLYPNQEVIIASGHAEDGRARAAVDLGADWLAKPYQKDDLARAVRRRLDRG